MPSVTEFIEHNELYPAEQTLRDHPEILNALIDYMSINPDILLQNEQQCYAYPNKASQILSTGSSFRALVQKKQRMHKQQKQTEKYYPFLDRLFKNLIQNRKQTKDEDVQIQESLLGYINRVLMSLAKKTPEIYQYFKDNQEIMTALVNDNQFLRAFQQFWNIFMIQSTMGLYIFLKNLFLRALMFRIIDQQDTDNLQVYQALAVLYEELTKKLESIYLPEDEKQQLEEICGSFHDEDFITLMILKVSVQRPSKTYQIARLFNSVLKNPLNSLTPLPAQIKKQEQKKARTEDQLQVESNTDKKHMSEKYSLNLSLISDNYLEVIDEFFESYEQSPTFMDFLMPDQLQVLKFMTKLSEKRLLSVQADKNLLKRLLVYSSVHKNNSLIHCMFLKTLTVISEGSDQQEVFRDVSVMSFLIKNRECNQRHSWNSLIYKICKFWDLNPTIKEQLSKEEKEFVEQIVSAKQNRLKGLTMYKADTTLLLEDKGTPLQQTKQGEKDSQAPNCINKQE